MRVFVPVEDTPTNAIIPMLVPYRCGLTCEHALREPVQAGWPRKSASDDDSDGQMPRLQQLSEA